MELNIDKLLDPIGQNILRELKADARMSYSQLGRVVGLSTPAVTERVRKLEEAGVIRGYHARIREKEMDSAVTAFIELSAVAAQYDRVKKTANKLDQVLECHHVSGDAAFVLKICVATVSDLESVVAQFSPLGTTRTSIVLSSSKDGSQTP